MDSLPNHNHTPDTNSQIINLDKFRQQKYAQLVIERELEKQNDPHHLLLQNIEVATRLFAEAKIFQTAFDEIGDKNSPNDLALKILFEEKITDYYQRGKELMAEIIQNYSLIESNLTINQASQLFEKIIKIQANDQNSDYASINKIRQIIHDLDEKCPNQSFFQGQPDHRHNQTIY